MRLFVFMALTLTLLGCVRTSVVPLSADTVQISAGAAPACGQVGAQQVAITTAAIETIRRGYDGFFVVGGECANNVGVIGMTPLHATTTGTISGNISTYGTGYGGSYGSLSGSTLSNTTVTGGQPIFGGTHNQSFVIKMVKEGDEVASRAVDARAVLGPDWQKMVADGAPNTCG